MQNVSLWCFKHSSGNYGWTQITGGILLDKTFGETLMADFKQVFRNFISHASFKIKIHDMLLSHSVNAGTPTIPLETSISDQN